MTKTKITGSTMTILGHEVGIDLNINQIGSIAENEIIDIINQSILDGNDCGYSDIKTDGLSFNWEIIEDENIKMLESENKLMAKFLITLGYNQDQISEIANTGMLQ